MNWYISKIVFKISSENTHHKPQFDEQLRLIAAASEEEAFIKARTIGIGEEDSFLNDRNNTVKWEFINVPKFCARFSGGLISAMYAPAVVKLAPIIPAIILPRKSQLSVGANAVKM